MQMVHVTIMVKDIEESIAFYKEFVELEIKMDMREMGAPIVFLTDAKGGTAVELIQSEDVYSGSGISMGFHVDDVKAKHAELQEKGIEVTPLISPNPNTTFFYIFDPNGVKIQFI